MTRPHHGAEAMTSPNDVAALVERLREQIANADADIADALLDAAATGEPVDPDDWHVEVPVNWLRETVATIAALQAEVERAKEEMSNVIIQAGCLRHYSRKPDGMPTIGEIQAGHFEDMAVRAFPSLATLLGREQTARSASRKETTPDA